MNKDTEIKAIKEEQRKLADRLEALEKMEDQSIPKHGEVWADWNRKPFLIDDRGGMTYVSNGHHYRDHSCITDHSFSKCKRIGTFDEVYIEREKVRDIVNRSRDYPAYSYSSNGCYSLSNVAKMRIAEILKELL